MPNPAISAFVAKQLAEGASLGTIKSELLQAGWPVSEVEAATAEHATIQPRPGNPGLRIWLIGAGVLVVLLMALANYLVLHSKKGTGTPATATLHGTVTLTDTVCQNPQVAIRHLAVAPAQDALSPVSLASDGSFTISVPTTQPSLLVAYTSNPLKFCLAGFSDPNTLTPLTLSASSTAQAQLFPLAYQKDGHALQDRLTRLANLPSYTSYAHYLSQTLPQTSFSDLSSASNPSHLIYLGLEQRLNVDITRLSGY